MPQQVLDATADEVTEVLHNDAVKAPLPEAVPAHAWRIHGRDYDMSSFVDEHPGGRVSILLGKGVDCTNLFESYHVFSEPRKRLQKYALDGLDEPVPDDPSAFHRDFRTLVKEHFRGQPRWSHKAKASHNVLMGGVIGVCIASWFGWLTGQSWAVVTLPVSAWLIMVNIAHDGSHFAVSRQAWINELGLAMASPFYYNTTSWYIQHVVSHHQETNQIGRDADLHHMPNSRWHPDVPHASRFTGVGNVLWQTLAFALSSWMMTMVHPFKFILWPFAEACLYGKERMSGVYWGNHKATPTPPHDFSGPTELSVMRISGALVRSGYHAQRVALDFGLWLWSVATFTLPWVLYYDNLPKALAFSATPYIIASVFFMVVTQVSHVQRETQTRAILDEPDFFKRQAMTSMDYNASWNLVRFWTGGLNLQSIHHVYPGLNSSHYTDIYPAFLALCRKHGCAPAQSPSVLHALASHLLYVYRLGADYRWPDMEM